MTRFIEILISLAIVAVLFLLVGLVLPSSRHLSKSVETNRKMTIVYDTLNSVRRFDDWNPLVLQDPKIDLERSGPDSGVGARVDYSSSKPAVGSGSWEIVSTEPKRSVVYKITGPGRGHDKQIGFYLKPTGRNNRNVEITETYDVSYGWDLLGRYAGLYVSRHVGDLMDVGLQRLSNILAQVPNVDYRVPGSRMTGMTTVDLPAENLLVVNAGSIERNNDKIKASMKSNMEWIKRSMDASGLVAAGPMRIVSSELGRETYTFDVVQPVRKAGRGDAKQDEPAADDAAGEDQADEAGNAGDVAAIPAEDAPELTGLKLLGPVKYEHTEPTRAATAHYTGFLVELENVRDALRAWALTQGFEAVGRPFEIYRNGIDAAFTADGEYDVYWKLKK